MGQTKTRDVNSVAEAVSKALGEEPKKKGPSRPPKKAAWISSGLMRGMNTMKSWLTSKLGGRS